MSEFKDFKVGDKVVFKYGSMPKDLMTIEFVSLDGSCVDVFEDFNPVLSEVLDFATPEEIASGHRIDFPTLPKPVGSLQELHPEFAKVLHENFLELLGDDFPIENRISPLCKSKDV